MLYVHVGHYQLDYTHLPICGEKVLKTNFGIELWRLKKFQNSKNGLCTCQFFYWFLMKRISCLMFMKSLETTMLLF
jgi:hypothetical protein